LEFALEFVEDRLEDVAGLPVRQGLVRVAQGQAERETAVFLRQGGVFENVEKFRLFDEVEPFFQERDDVGPGGRLREDEGDVTDDGGVFRQLLITNRGGRTVRQDVEIDLTEIGVRGYLPAGGLMGVDPADEPDPPARRHDPQGFLRMKTGGQVCGVQGPIRDLPFGHQAVQPGFGVPEFERSGPELPVVRLIVPCGDPGQRQVLGDPFAGRFLLPMEHRGRLEKADVLLALPEVPVHGQKEVDQQRGPQEFPAGRDGILQFDERRQGFTVKFMGAVP